MTHPFFLAQWLRIPLLVMTLALAGLATPAYAQISGNLASDQAMINGAMAAAIAATGAHDAENSRLSMEALYRQWRLFRAKNFADPANGPRFVPSMEKVEAALFAASKLVDSDQLGEAQTELLSARKLFQAALQPPPESAKPAAEK